MRWRALQLALLALGCATVSPAVSQEVADAPADVGSTWAGYALVASDYVYRGVSQSQRKPVLQLDVEYQHTAGLYAGAYVSNVDYTSPGSPSDGVHIEFATRAGWRTGVSTWGALELSAEYMHYPGARANVGYDFVEYGVALDVGDHVSLHIGHAPNYYGLGGAATDYGGDVAWELGAYSVGLGAGYYDQHDLVGAGYSYLDLTASRQYGPVRVEAGVSNTFGYSSAIAAVNGDPRLARRHARVAWIVAF